MSRFFDSPFHAPRVGHPLTPPDTDVDYTSHLHATGANSMGLGIDVDPPLPSSHTPGSVTETPQYPPRKPSSVAYINSNIRESRERTVHRGLKWLVVVVPPASFAQEHGHLGQTLSSGPSHRLTQGILMPLYPSMTTQLTAIAKEFSFPSTSGICLYLHTAQAGVTVTPRISEESWNVLWSHLFDARSPAPSSSQIPIGGKIEFDIDFRRARWYDSWMSIPRREVDVPQSVVPSRPPTLGHFRGESRTTFADEPADDQLQLETISLMQQQARPRLNRHVPRKLSLLDRFDATSIRSGSKLVPRQHSPPSPTAHSAHVVHALSPIVQESSPVNDRRHLDQLVTTWRAGAAKAVPSPMAATGQTSLDPVNLPNTFPLDDSTPEDKSPTSEINLADYAWSISSAGPPEYDSDLDTYESWSRVPSVHLDRRNEGSVMLTPTTVTSLALWDVDWEYSPVSNVDRLPSPDIAGRMIEDCPPTPSTHTSWGPPSEYPPSPTSDMYFYHRAPSVDLAHRGEFSRPVTPSTATSWGPPSEYPPSPSSDRYFYYRAPSIDLGHRGEFSRPVTPSTATSWGPPESWPASPASPYYVRTPDAGDRCFNIDDGFVQAAPSRPWNHVWPYHSRSNSEASEVGNTSDAGSEESNPWNQVWPYNASRTRQAGELSTGYPHFNLYPAVTKVEKQAKVIKTVRVAEDSKEVSVHLEHRYPNIVIYPAAYPHFDIYGTLIEKDHSVVPGIPVKLAAHYPTLDIYPAVYPWSLASIYPSIEANSIDTDIDTSVSVDLPAVYPSLLIYTPVYPYNLESIYPARSVQSISTRPTIQAKQATKVAKPLPVPSPSKGKSETAPKPQQPVLLETHYPVIELYPPVYPHNLDTIYPPRLSLGKKSSVSHDIPVLSPVVYPSFNIYPAVYPWSLETIYPAVSVTMSPKKSEASRGAPVKLTAHYPAFELYPAVYPWSLECIYPAVSIERSRPGNTIPVRPDSTIEEGIQVTLPSVYPVLSIYPNVYPYNLETIYPARHEQPKPSRMALPRLSMPRRPAITLNVSGLASPYAKKDRAREHAHSGRGSSAITSARLSGAPPVPPLPTGLQRKRSATPLSGLPTTKQVRFCMEVPVQLPFTYPAVQPYPPVYPYFSIYPEVAVSSVSNKEAISATPHSSYPYLVIYPAVYPHLDIYPSASGLQQATKVAPRHIQEVVKPSRDIQKPRSTHLDLHVQVFGKSEPAPAPAPVPTPVTRQIPKQSPKFTHEDLHNQVFSKSQSPSRRELPTPPSNTPPAAASTPVPVIRRTRSGTMSNRPPLPTPPSEGSSSPSPSRLPLGRQIPMPPTEGSPQPRTYGLPATPSIRRASTFVRTTPTLPSVPEPGAAFSPGGSSASPRYAMTASPLPVSPESASAPRQARHSIYGVTLRPVTQTSPSATSPPGTLQRNRTLPQRPIPGRRDSVPLRSHTFQAAASVFEAQESQPLKLSMSSLAQFPSPPRPPLPTIPSAPRPANNRPS